MPPSRKTHSRCTHCNIVRAQVHAAFDEVALSYSCTLPTLLQATRRLGLQDNDVRTILVLDELDEQDGVESDRHFRCYRSNTGVLHLTRDTAAPNERASVLEVFVAHSQRISGR